MRIDMKQVNRILAKNLLGHLERLHLREGHLAQLAGISDTEAHSALAGGGTTAYALYRMAVFFQCTTEDLFAGLYDHRNLARRNLCSDRRLTKLTLDIGLMQEIDAIAERTLNDAAMVFSDGLSALLVLLDRRMEAAKNPE
jgi:hypothetical protein